MKAVLQWVLRTMMKDQTGIVRTMPKKDLVDFNVAMTAERLMRNGFDPNAFKNANQVENAINQIEAPRNVQQGIKSTQTAKVFNIEGKELDPKKPIMGGTQTGKELSKELSDRLRGTETDRIKQRIADKKVETEAEIKKKLDKGNKEGIAKINRRLAAITRQKMLDDAIDDASPGFSGDRKVDAELVAENLAERMGKVYDDLPTKERLDLYDQAFQGLTKKRFDPEDMAQGGRAGFKMGRRAFLKLMGGVGAGIGALKTGLLNLGKEAAPMVEAAKETVTKAPDYFFALVDKIKRFGNAVDDSVADPRIERTYRYKNYELRENAFGEPGETVVTKTDDMGEFGYKEESMRFKKGEQTEDGFMPDEYEEVTIRPDAEGKLKDIEDGIEDVSEIIEEATKSAPPIKKAGGGIARMLGE